MITVRMLGILLAGRVYRRLRSFRFVHAYDPDVDPDRDLCGRRCIDGDELCRAYVTCPLCLLEMGRRW